MKNLNLISRLVASWFAGRPKVVRARTIDATTSGGLSALYGDIQQLAALGLLPRAASVPALENFAADNGNTYIRWCIPGRDPSGTEFRDISGRGNHAAIEANNTGPFAVDSRISTVVHASAGGVVLPQVATQCDLSTDSVVMSFAMTRANPAANDILASFGASAANNPGIYFSHRQTVAGVGRVVANRGAAGQLVSGADSAVAFSNAGGTVERHVTMAYDAPTRSLYLWRDGVVVATNVGALAGAADWIIPVVNAGARLGAQLGGATVAGVFRGWQGYVFAGRGLPLNINRVAAVLAEAPSVPLRNEEFQF